MPIPRSPKPNFSVDTIRPLYVSEANGKVVAVLIAIADWITFLERMCDLEQKLRPSSALDRRLDAIVRKQLAKKKKLDLDDIGFLGTGRTMSEAESLLMSAHIQTLKSKQVGVKHRAKDASAKLGARTTRT